MVDDAVFVRMVENYLTIPKFGATSNLNVSELA
jgi:hypothetical protein